MSYRENVPRLETVVIALRSLGGQARPAAIANEIRRLFPGPHPRTLLNSVRGRLQEYSSDSKLYRGRNDLFYSVHGIGGGVWGLRAIIPTTNSETGPTSEDELDRAGVLDKAIRRLEDGAQPTYGSSSELRERQELSASVNELRNAVARLRPEHGGIGHNLPPADEQTDMAGLPVIAQALDKATIIQTEMMKEEPDALKVARSTRWMQQFAQWLSGKADVFAEEFAREFGKSLGKSLGVAVATTGVIFGLNLVIKSVERWINLVL